MDKRNLKLTTKDIAAIGIMVAVIEVCKVVLAYIPNVELTSFWIIMFTLYFGRKVIYVIPVFILIEGFLYGINIWWFMYLYAWPLLSILADLLRKMDSAFSWAMLSGIFGLSFGLLCSLPYIVIGTFDGGFLSGLRTAFAWWVAGIPWDIVHGIANFMIMLVLYHPVKRVMSRIEYNV